MILSQHFTYKRLLRYAMPTIIMMIFTSIYGVIDGFFVSNFAGKTPFSAINFIYPILMILGCVGFMFGTGGGALIAIALGEKDSEKANSTFSLVIYVSVIIGIILSVLGMLILRPLAVMMGAEGDLLENCLIYGRIFLAGLTSFILQFEFQCLFSAAGKPKLGMWVTILAGVTNIVLDALLVWLLNLGIVGAATATVISQVVGGVIPLVYFARKNSSLLRLGKFKMDWSALRKTCFNGSSEMMNNVSAAFVGIMYNVQLMRYAPENGVPAYGVLMYVNMIFQAIFFGYAVGTAPIVSYHYGAGNKREIKSLLRKSLLIVGITALSMFIAGELLGRPLALLFVGYDAALTDMTTRAFSLFSFSFLFSGFAIFGSTFFTALGNGVTSAIIATLRAFVFQFAAVLLFPLIWAVDGIWISIAAAEFMALLMTSVFLFLKRKQYQYF